METTYLTLAGDALDLSNLSDEQRMFFDRCYAAYSENMPWLEFAAMIAGHANPLVREARGWVTRIVYDHALFQAVRDLEDRLGLRQGELEPEDDVDSEREPLGDEWISVTEAARRKSVTVSGLHQAIARGDVIARPARPGGSWLVVSAGSLVAWQPNRRRQAAARRPAAAR
ncbi:MAG: hypothetical protein ACRDJE_07900 [Dehalococcoidia bacterium]